MRAKPAAMKNVLPLLLYMCNSISSVQLCPSRILVAKKLLGKNLYVFCLLASLHVCCGQSDEQVYRISASTLIIINVNDS